MRRARRSIIGLCAGLLPVFLMAQACWAESLINTNRRGLAVKDYDVVAYFILGEPTKGDSDFSDEWQGATWRFANAGHLEAFKADPEKYAPQYGGY